MTNKEAKEKLYLEWQKFLEDNIDYAGVSEAYKMAFKALEQEPKTGHWVKMPLIEVGQSYSHECSECGRKILAMNENLSEFPYCYCGARMRGDAE